MADKLPVLLFKTRMQFTTRPELTGTFGMVSTTHWLASAAGLSMLEKGGTAADAAVAAGFVLNVVEPHLNGPLGDMSAMIWPSDQARPTVVCGQGTAPAKATLDHYISEGLTLIPGSGLLAAVVPGQFDAFMLMLRDHGRLSFREVMTPALGYARSGHPILPRVCATIASMAEVFETEWTSSAPIWLPRGKAPSPGELFANPQLADFWQRLVDEAETASGREAQIEAARTAFHEGFVAEAIDAFMQRAEALDATGARRKGVLQGKDMASWRAHYEEPISVEHNGWNVFKCGAWTQGPVLLQALQTLSGETFSEMDPNGDTFVHLVTETLKLAMADRETYLGDPLQSDIPLNVLLSDAYGQERRKLIGREANFEHQPGQIAGFEAQVDAFQRRIRRETPEELGVGVGEPTMAHLTEQRGDTVHIDVVDQWGNAVSATPSGGWLKSNPVVPGLGVPLNTRAQMFWLEESGPNALAPGRRPRSTLSPSMALRPDGARLALGTPGGDQQDQWQLIYLLRLIHFESNLQEGIDSPLFHTGHLQASFYPRGCETAQLVVEPSFSVETRQALSDRGHRVEVATPWSVGRLTAAESRPNGTVAAAATPRLMQAYAMGR